MNQEIKNALDDHIKNPVDEDQPRDLIDSYLTEIKKTTQYDDRQSSFYKERGCKFMLQELLELFKIYFQ